MTIPNFCGMTIPNLYDYSQYIPNIWDDDSQFICLIILILKHSAHGKILRDEVRASLAAASASNAAMSAAIAAVEGNRQCIHVPRRPRRCEDRSFIYVFI